MGVRRLFLLQFTPKKIKARAQTKISLVRRHWQSQLLLTETSQTSSKKACYSQRLTNEPDAPILRSTLGENSGVHRATSVVRLNNRDAMNRSVQNHRVTKITSVPAALTWFGVLAFLAKWFQAWSVGRLEPGSDTSWMALLMVFIVALLASGGGIYLSIRAWQGRSHVKWQVISLIGAVLVLWAVSGD